MEICLVLFILIVIFSLALYIHAINSNSKIQEEEKLKKQKEQEQKIKKEKVKEEHERYIKEKKEEFKKNLNNIPEIKIELSTEKIKKRKISDMPETKHTTIRKNTSVNSLSNFVVLDIETTGLNPRNNEIIEISAIKYKNFEPTECMSTLIKPKKEITEEITKINNITNGMCSNAPSISEVIPAFSNFIKGYNLVGYNIDFDLKFLYVNGLSIFEEKREIFDVLELAKKYIKRDEIYNYKLTEVFEYLAMYRDESHRALSDTYATALVYKKLIEEFITFN